MNDAQWREAAAARRAVVANDDVGNIGYPAILPTATWWNCYLVHGTGVLECVDPKRFRVL